MNSWNSGAFSTCPHCGRKLANGNLARHVRICISRQDVRASTLAALDAGNGNGRRREEYNTYRGGAPCMRSLEEQLGTHSWEAILQHFGLRFERTYNNHKATLIVAAGYAAVAHAEERITVCGLPVCRIVDYGNRVGFVLR